MIELTPFLCEILEAGDMVGKLSSMGQANINQEQLPKGFIYAHFVTKNYQVRLTGRSDESYPTRLNPKGLTSLMVYRTDKKSWSFSENELADWLSSSGLDVLKEKNKIIGVAGYDGHDMGPSAVGNPFNYGFRTYAKLSAKPTYTIYFSIENQSQPKAAFCK